MIRLRLVLLLAGAGTLLAGLPAQTAQAARAAAPPIDAAAPPTDAAAVGEPRALQLLTAAAQAARARTYYGTQYVSTWRADAASSDVADIEHTPGGGSVVHLRPTAVAAPRAGSGAVATLGSDLDLQLLRLLAQHYDLAVAPDDTCTGRTAHVVEARRPGRGGTAAVAGRFWVDADSALVLRREVFDLDGRLVRSSAFSSLTVDPRLGAPTTPQPAAGRLGSDRLDQLRGQGWVIPNELPGDLELFDARLRSHSGTDVLHLSYSDGLSTLSLFAQRGRLGTAPMSGFVRTQVGASRVWVRSASPERVVWGGGGRVFTLLSDAPSEAVRGAVGELPHDAAPGTGVLARLSRGLARLAHALNPFD